MMLTAYFSWITKSEVVGGLLGLVGIGDKNLQENTLLGKLNANMQGIIKVRRGSNG